MISERFNDIREWLHRTVKNRNDWINMRMIDKEKLMVIYRLFFTLLLFYLLSSILISVFVFRLSPCLSSIIGCHLRYCCRFVSHLWEFSYGLIRRYSPNYLSSSLLGYKKTRTLFLCSYFLFYISHFTSVTFIGSWEHWWNNRFI